MLDIEGDNGINSRIVALYTVEVQVKQFNGGHLSLVQRLKHRGCWCEGIDEGVIHTLYFPYCSRLFQICSIRYTGYYYQLFRKNIGI